MPAKGGKGIMYGKISVWSEGTETLEDLKKTVVSVINDCGYPEQREVVDMEEEEEDVDPAEVVRKAREKMLESDDELRDAEDEVEEEERVDAPWMKAKQAKV